MLGSVEKNQVDETILRQLKRTIHTNIPSPYMENITNEVVPKVGVDFEEEKEIYHVKVFFFYMPLLCCTFIIIMNQFVNDLFPQCMTCFYSCPITDDQIQLFPANVT